MPQKNSKCPQNPKSFPKRRRYFFYNFSLIAETGKPVPESPQEERSGVSRSASNTIIIMYMDGINMYLFSLVQFIKRSLPFITY